MTARNLPGGNLPISSFADMLGSLDIGEHARKSGWMVRKARKIEAASLVTAFCLMVFGAELTFRKVAMRLGLMNLVKVSAQAVWKRVNDDFVSLLASLVSQAMTMQMARPPGFATSPLFARFLAVLIQDSSCINMPASLYPHYKGNSNKGGNKSVAKLDVLLDIKGWRLVRILLNPFRKNDQSQAGGVVGLLRPRMLLIRDLGYYSVPALHQIDQAGAFFLTRLKYGTVVYDANGKRVVLETMLWRKGRVDMRVKVGGNKVRMRLVAVPLSDKAAGQRRKKAREDRDRRLNHGPAYMFRLGWTILLTNVPEEVWTAQQALEAYGFRWQVETMFKSWKSYLGVDRQPTKRKIESPCKAEAIILAQLLVVVTMIMPVTAFHFEKCQRQGEGHMVSPLKIAMFITLCIEADETRIAWIMQNTRYYCAYDKRMRGNATQKLYNPA